MSAPSRTAKRTKPQHGPPITLFGEQYRRTHEHQNARDANCYREYGAWCRRMGLPVADFQTWRMTTARLSNF